MASKTRAPLTGDLITRPNCRGGRLHRLKWKQHQERDLSRHGVSEAAEAREGEARVDRKHPVGDEG